MNKSNPDSRPQDDNGILNKNTSGGSNVNEFNHPSELANSETPFRLLDEIKKAAKESFDMEYWVSKAEWFHVEAASLLCGLFSNMKIMIQARSYESGVDITDIENMTIECGGDVSHCFLLLRDSGLADPDTPINILHWARNNSWCKKRLDLSMWDQHFPDIQNLLIEDTSSVDDTEIIPFQLVHETRGYIEKVVFQINKTYQLTCYDACMVMIRKLVEILIIECFESNNKVDEISDQGGNVYCLSDLVSKFTKKKKNNWILDKPTKNVLPKITSEGNHSVHSRRTYINKSDIDQISRDLQRAVTEMLTISKLIK